MRMNLRLVSSCAVLIVKLEKPDSVMESDDKRTCAHNPLAILTDANTVTRFLKLKVLQQLNAVRILWIILQAALAAACKPFGEWPGTVGARDGINRDLRGVGQLHDDVQQSSLLLSRAERQPSARTKSKIKKKCDSDSDHVTTRLVIGPSVPGERPPELRISTFC